MQHPLSHPKNPAIFLGIMLIYLLIFPVIAEAKRYATKAYCNDPDYECIKVRSGQSWQSLFKDPIERDIVMRLNRVNGNPWGGQTIVVPKDMSSKDHLDYAPFPRAVNPIGKNAVIVFPSELAWAAYDKHGHLVHWGPMSGGKDWCSDTQEKCRTVNGMFEVYRKGGGGCKSRKFDGAPMPYCMFFKGGFALHGSNSVPGYHASHGCVRMYTKDAKWLNRHFVTLPKEGGTIVIVGDYY